MAKGDPLEAALGRRGALKGHAAARASDRYPRAINIALDEETFRAIAVYAAKHGMQKNDTVRRILREGLAAEIAQLGDLG